MSPQPMGFLSAEKTQDIVGRQIELEHIKNAIYRPDDSLQVVLVRGPAEAEARGEREGGYGKTRLLQEVWKNTQPGGRWSSLGDAVTSDPVDLFDIRLHARSHFLREVRDKFLGLVEFSRYDEAYDRYQRLFTKSSEYHYLIEAAEEAVEAFLDDYREAARQRRLVWLIDTVEQLAVVSSAWLIERGLISSEHMQARTLTWLTEHIRVGSLPNTTLLLAGRGGEGKDFFAKVTSAANQSGGKAHLEEVRAEPFDADETRMYVKVLAGEWAQRAEEAKTHSAAEAASYRRVSKILEDLYQREEVTKVVWLYTGGVPVRLALFANLLVEDRTIPIPLQMPWEKAITEVGTDDPRKVTPQLTQMQWKIEGRLINLLFAPNDLRARILQALVRARRGLTAEQLHFVLDNVDRLPPHEWERVADRRRIQQIDTMLKQMSSLFLVKLRPAGWELLNGTGETAAAERIGLQDEIYRIYAEHMAPPPEPMDDRARGIWNSLDESERERHRRNREDEKKARLLLYTQLRDWAEYQAEKLRAQQREYQRADERALRLSSPVESRQIGFPELSDAERERRAAIRTILFELELEYLYYSLLLDPAEGIASFYADLGYRLWQAANEESDIVSQAEMWRVLYDDFALRFVDLEVRSPMLERGETPLYVLRRVARQEDAARWIKRFVVRKEYRRAIQFADALELEIDRLKHGKEQDIKDWVSWNHTFARGERLCWRNYAQILVAQEISRAISALEVIGKNFERLAHSTVEEIAIPASEAVSGKGERGFKGVDENDPTRRTHPGYSRLQRLISYAYNFVGYGCVTLGWMHHAVDYYGMALRYARETDAPEEVHQANVLNNLSRALSEIGRYSAVRVCQEGLVLRKRLAIDAMIAYSHNTLALIYNDLNRPEDAWLEAATAVAYFRRTEDPRGLGLALLQLGEALRRMANQARFGRVLPAEPDSLYSAAESYLKEAHSLFVPPEKASPDRRQLVNEPVRLIEAKIELGCLYRDRIRALDPDERSPQWRMRYREALSYLEGALREAQAHRLERLELDAQVDLAWTHYLAEEIGKAEAALQAAEDMLQGKNCFIRPNPSDKEQGFVPDPTQIEEIYILPQLGRIYGLRGLIAFRQFRERVDALQHEFPERAARRHARAHEDAPARRFLEQAAEAYTLGTAYTQLYSVRSATLTTLYDHLYHVIKKFNSTELEDFHAQVLAQRKRYPIDQIRLKMGNPGDVHDFLHETFGLAYQPQESE